MYYSDAVIVVEGTSDSAYLSSFIDTLYVETNGYSLAEEEIDFLKNLPAWAKIIILTDSDEAGKRIRQTINQCVDDATNIEVDISKCNKNKKHGVAECTKEEIINVLKEHFVDKKQNNDTVTTFDLINCGINNAETRKYLCRQMHLGKCNNKEMIKRLNFLKISKIEIEKVMEKYCGN